jgi:hypothetical protein
MIAGWLREARTATTFQAILPPLRTFGIASPVVKKNTEQPMLKGRKALQGAISPAYAVELI